MCLSDFKDGPVALTPPPFLRDIYPNIQINSNLLNPFMKSNKTAKQANFSQGLMLRLLFTCYAITSAFLSITLATI